jgi:phage terminase small subunit
MAEQHDLTPKQRAFVDHYLATSNCVEASRRAGYKGNDHTLHSIGSENLRKPAIKAAIEERQRPIEQARIASAQEVLSFLSSVMVDKAELTNNRVRAAELLGKRYLLWQQRDGEDLPELGEPLYTPGKKP